MADLTITAANVVLASGTPKSIIAGTTITAGMALYKKASDGKAYGSLSDTVADATFIGIALGGASAGQYVMYAGTNGDVITIGATTVKGETYVVSANAGKIAPVGDLATGNYVSRIGMALNVTQITLDINITGVTHA